MYGMVLEPYGVQSLWVIKEISVNCQNMFVQVVKCISVNVISCQRIQL